MSDYNDFSSFPADIERQFVPFEEHTRQAGKKARNIGLVVGGGLLVAILAVVMTHEPTENQHAKGLYQEDDAGTGSLGAEKEAAPTPTPAAATDAAPAADAAPAGDAAPAADAAPGGDAAPAADAAKEAPPKQ